MTEWVRHADDNGAPAHTVYALLGNKTDCEPGTARAVSSREAQVRLGVSCCSLGPGATSACYMMNPRRARPVRVTAHWQ